MLSFLNKFSTLKLSSNPQHILALLKPFLFYIKCPLLPEFDSVVLKRSLLYLRIHFVDFNVLIILFVLLDLLLFHVGLLVINLDVFNGFISFLSLQDLSKSIERGDSVVEDSVLSSKPDPKLRAFFSFLLSGLHIPVATKTYLVYKWIEIKNIYIILRCIIYIARFMFYFSGPTTCMAA